MAWGAKAVILVQSRPTKPNFKDDETSSFQCCFHLELPCTSLFHIHVPKQLNSASKGQLRSIWNQGEGESRSACILKIHVTYLVGVLESFLFGWHQCSEDASMAAIGKSSLRTGTGFDWLKYLSLWFNSWFSFHLLFKFAAAGCELRLWVESVFLFCFLPNAAVILKYHIRDNVCHSSKCNFRRKDGA